MHSTVKHISTLNPFCPVIFLYCLTWSPNNDDCTKSGWYIFEQCMHFGGGWVGLVGGTAPVWGVGAWVLVGGTSGWGDVWGGLQPVRCGDASAQCGGGSKKGEPVSQSLLLLLLLLPMVPILSSILSLSCRTSARWLEETDRRTLLGICNMRLGLLCGDGGGWSKDCELVRRR